jgi:hypothetical protein
MYAATETQEGNKLNMVQLASLFRMWDIWGGVLGGYPVFWLRIPEVFLRLSEKILA